MLSRRARITQPTTPPRSGLKAGPGDLAGASVLYESIAGGAVDAHAAEHGTCLADCIRRLAFLRAEFAAKSAIFEHATTETREVVTVSRLEQLHVVAGRCATAERIVDLTTELGELAQLIPSFMRVDIIEQAAAVRSVAGQAAALFVSLRQPRHAEPVEAWPASRLLAETASLAARLALVLEKLARQERARRRLVSAVGCAECVARLAMSAMFLCGFHVSGSAWFVAICLGMRCWTLARSRVSAICRFVLVLVSSAAPYGIALTWAFAEVLRSLPCRHLMRMRLWSRAVEPGETPRTRREVLTSKLKGSLLCLIRLVIG